MLLLGNLASALNIRAGEGWVTLFLLGLSFLLGLARMLFMTAAYVLFLSTFNASLLPYVYLGSSVIVSLAGFSYLKLESRLPLGALLTTNLGVVLASFVMLWVGLVLSAMTWITLLLPIWFEVVVALTRLAFWGLAGRLFTLRQGKRLFGLIGSGAVIAPVIGGLLTPVLVDLVGTPNLLLLSAFAMAAALVLLIATLRAFAATLSLDEATELAPERVVTRELIRNRYIIFVFVLTFFSLLAYSFLDNVFYDRAGAQYPDENQLASFLGSFAAIAGLLSLLTTALISSPLLGRYGLLAGLLAAPVLIAASASGTAAVGSFTTDASLLFWLVSLTKLIDTVLRDSIDGSAVQILYQPLPANQRAQALTLVETVVAPLGMGVAGLLLLLFGTLLAFTAVQLTYLLLLVLAAWITVALWLGQEYSSVLLRSLAKRRVGGGPLSLSDSSSIAVLEQALSSSRSGEVLYALAMLEESDHEQLPGFVCRLVNHATPEVRLEALRRIEQLGLSEALETVRRRVAIEPLVSVRGAALRTLAALSAADDFEQLWPYLEDPSPEIRRGAMVGLLRSGGVEGVLATGERLLQLVGTPDPAGRIAAAQVLGEVALRSFYQPLLKLLLDADIHVRQAALAAAGKVKNPKLWPMVLAAIATPRLRGPAAAALIAGGETALPAIRVAFEMAEQPHETLIRLARISGQIGGENAVSFLADKLGLRDQEVRSQVLRSLSACRYQPSGAAVQRVTQQIRLEVAHAARGLSALAELGQDAETALLRQALAQELAVYREHLFFLLSFLYDRAAVLRARDTLVSGSLEKRAYALEVLDILLPAQLKELVLPLIDDITLPERLERLDPLFPRRLLGLQGQLCEMIHTAEEWTSHWTRTCALYTAGVVALASIADTAGVALSDPDPVVRETAGWILATLGEQPPSGGQVHSGGKVMLTTIEKVLILKTVSIFAETPDDVLAEVAAILTEVEVTSGTLIFAKGDPGNCLYMIVSGGVRIHDGDNTLRELSERAVFGEMSVLDLQPRSASVTALEDTCLLRLDQAPLYELMADRIEVARGIIRVLSLKFRESIQDVAALRAQLRAVQGNP